MTADDRIRELAEELDQARRQQNAVAEILRALRGGMQLQPILDQIAAAAAELCRADSSFLYLREGDLFHMRANFGQPAEVVEYERRNPDRAGPHSCTGRVAMTKRPVHIPDVYADPGYAYPSSELHAVRTLLGLPVLVDDDLVGVFGVARHEQRPFDDREIELMATFADQSAIAIANAKLFETVERQRGELARFVSPEVAALVSSDEGVKLLSGHRAYISVVFFDLRGFTAFAETAEPEELRKRGYDLGLGAGIAVGYATLGRIGFEGRYDYGALGSVTNLAARLSDEAAGGEILLSQRAYAALEEHVDAEPLPPLPVKGFSRPAQPYRLVGLRD